LAILPAVIICSWILYRDRYDKEPIILLILCFFAGVGSAFPAICMEEYGFSLGITESGDILETFTLAFGVVAFSEEFVKFACVMLFAYPWKAFDEPLDGIVYSIMVSMGFATLENLIYSDIHGMQTVLLRAVTAVPAHAAFAIFMGYHIGLSKFSDSNKYKFQHLFLGFAGAVILHGSYDFFLLQNNIPALSVLALVILAISVFYTQNLVKLLSEESEKNNTKEETPNTIPVSSAGNQDSIPKKNSSKLPPKKDNWDEILE
jgi:RsiW-degrading membrane proteinase PrsW (M82 family)